MLFSGIFGKLRFWENNLMPAKPGKDEQVLAVMAFENGNLTERYKDGIPQPV